MGACRGRLGVGLRGGEGDAHANNPRQGAGVFVAGKGGSLGIVSWVEGQGAGGRGGACSYPLPKEKTLTDDVVVSNNSTEKCNASNP